MLVEPASGTDGTFRLPEPPYGLSDLEPYIDESTMRLHYYKHFNGYRTKLNAAASASNLTHILRTAISSGDATVRNNGGVHP